MRIREAATGFPSIASGEAYLIGFISGNDGSPSYAGIFQGWGSRSLYTYRWSSELGPQWSRHARKDEVDRFSQIGSDQTRIYAGNGKTYLEIGNDRAWGVYNGETGQWKPLDLAQGGTAGRNAEQARTNIEAMYERKSNLDSTNINTLTGEYSGFYSQGLSANATSANGYPTQSAGALLVIKNGANGNAGCTQLYFPFNATNGVFYMRQHIIQSSATDWEWTTWKKFQSLDVADSPQFKNLNLVISSDNETTNGGILQSILNDTSGAQRAISRIYTEFRGDGKAWTTTHLQSGSGNKYAGLNEDGDFALSEGSFIGKTAKLLSNVSNPFTLQSTHPTIKFDETDRPEGAPDYAFICDGGNWRIERDHWDESKAKDCISYSYSKQEVTVQNLLAQNVAIHGSSSSGAGSLRIESQRSSDEGMYIQAWGNGTDRLSVLEVKVDSGFLFYAQKVADGSKELRVNGSVTCTTVNQTSDRDLKDNIQVIGDATEAIRKMNGYTYTLKENGLPYAGVIAQEVMEALPEAVGSFTHYGEELQGPTVDGRELREETRYLNVDYAAVTGLLVQVARETDNRVTELEEENASLRANIAEMDERIAKLEELVSKLTEGGK